MSAGQSGSELPQFNSPTILLAENIYPSTVLQLDPDAALQAVCASLQGLAVGEQAGRKWERLQMQQFNTPLHEDEGLVCAELVFSTSARYMGNPQAQ